MVRVGLADSDDSIVSNRLAVLTLLSLPINI